MEDGVVDGDWKKARKMMCGLYPDNVKGFAELVDTYNIHVHDKKGKTLCSEAHAAQESTQSLMCDD